MKAVKSGVLKIGSLEMKCHVLEDGMRIIEEQSMIDFMAWLESGELLTDADAKEFATKLNDPNQWE